LNDSSSRLDSLRRSHPFFSASAPLVFAHRGGAALSPENTIAAFERARALRVDGLEIDVRLSGDGHVVLLHDRTLDRTTELRGAVSGYSAAELARHGVPRLADVLAGFSELRLIIELKENAVELARRVVDDVRAAGAVPRVCLGSFGYRVLNAVRAAAPEIVTSAAREEVRWALYRSWMNWTPRRPRYGGFQVPEIAGRTRVVSPRFVDAAHRAGLAVQVWTVDDPGQAERLLTWGADAIITDRPDIMVPLVERFGVRA
jgi:glycerophosphoryl diester phosphodiesterase